MSEPPAPAEDRAAIADLVHRYALHIRRGEPEHCPLLFVEQGAFEVREADPREAGSLRVRSRAEGREAIGAYVGGSTRGGRMVPLIHNLLIELDGDRATASSMMAGTLWPTGTEVLGEYADSFVREAGRWLFAERIYTIWRAAAD